MWEDSLLVESINKTSTGQNLTKTLRNRSKERNLAVGNRITEPTFEGTSSVRPKTYLQGFYVSSPNFSAFSKNASSLNASEATGLCQF